MTAVAVVTLCLGIGATTAIFSVVQEVLVRPLPFAESGRLVAVHAVRPTRATHPAYADSWNRGLVSMGSWDLLRSSEAFDDVAGWSTDPTVRLLEPEAGRLLLVYKATSNLLPLLGVRPVIGRGLTKTEDEASNDSALLRYELWRDLFGSDPTIIGRRLVVALARSGDFVSSYEIVGVLPAGFTLGGLAPDLIRPPGSSAGTHRTHSTPVLRIIGRLAPQATIASARSAADAVLRASEVGDPTEARLVPLNEDERRAAAPPAWLLVAAASLLLLVACANIAGLFLADARQRHPEMALRVALGSRPGHLVQQLAAEFVLLAGVAVTLGLFLAYWLIRLVAATAPPGLAGIEDAGINLRVAVFAGMMASSTVLICGFVPVLKLVRVPAAVVMAAGSARSSRSSGHGALVVAQASLTFTLVACATVLAEALFASASAPLGFNPRGLLLVSTTSAGTPRPALSIDHLQATTTSSGGDASPMGLFIAPSRARTRRLLESLETLPHVVKVAASSVGPFSTFPAFVRLQVEGLDVDAEYPAQVSGVTDAFFETMQIPILAGRGFEPGSNDSESVVVSHEFARRYLGPAPVGRYFHEVVGPKGQGARFRLRVIGVVGDTKQRRPRDMLAPVYYQRFAGDLGNVQHLLVRTTGDVAVVASDVRERLADVEPGVLVTQVEDVDRLVRQSMADERFGSRMSAIFAGAAVMLAMIGFYGLTVRRIAERRRELGIRVAIGASTRDVRVLVMRNVFRTIGTGLAVGMLLALLATAGLKANFASVHGASPLVFVSMALLFGGIAIGTVLVAVRRITSTEAVRVLTGTVD